MGCGQSNSTASLSPAQNQRDAQPKLPFSHNLSSSSAATQPQQHHQSTDLFCIYSWLLQTATRTMAVQSVLNWGLMGLYCIEQKLLLPNELELTSESSESGALSLSSAARHIDFHLLRRIYVAFVAHSIALSLQYISNWLDYCHLMGTMLHSPHLFFR